MLRNKISRGAVSDSKAKRHRPSHMRKAQISFPTSRRDTFQASFWKQSAHQPWPDATREHRVTRAEAVPGRTQTVMRQSSSSCHPVGLFTGIDVTVCAPTHFFSLNTQKMSGFSGTREFRVKTVYFHLLFPCRTMVALTHTVKDKLSFRYFS